MRKKINNYFIGGLLEDARPFEIARIKMVYSFTLFYYAMNFLGCIMFMQSGNYGIAIIGITITMLFTTGILTFLRKEKLISAILTYLSMHVIFGTCIFLIKKGAWSILDGGMFAVLIAFAFFTLGRKWGLIWISYLFVFVIVGQVNENSGGRLLAYDTINMPQDPPIMLFIPCLLIIYMFWVYLKSKEQAEKQIQEQKEQLSYQHLQITDSISYASRLQEAILPHDLNIILPDSFILYKPKEIVSGDFYWGEQKENLVFFAAVDCTGHGVPGAMVSMIGSAGLNKCVKELELEKPGEILDQLSFFVEETFSKSKRDVQDGMDLALCCLDNDNQTFSYAGANNPLYYISGEEFYEIKPDKQPIGKFSNRRPYTTHTIDAKPGDCFYIFTDGFADQFGGPSGKKFKYKAFKDLLLSIHHKPMTEQKEILIRSLEDWKGKLEQVDDICIIGMRI